MQSENQVHSRTQQPSRSRKIPPSDESDSLSSSEDLSYEEEFWQQHWGCARDMSSNQRQSTGGVSMQHKSTEVLNKEANEVFQLVKQASSEKQEIFNNKKICKNYIKLLVSKQKKRWESNGFSLDLTYITPRIIAMGFPAENHERWYRNSMVDVQNFFNKMHSNHYKVYNLCSERTYDKSRFPDVSYYPFEDHQAPEFTLMFRFCQDLFQYLHADPGKNTAGVHCKAGKGRTGVMICCYLMYSGEYENAIDALRYYGIMRTNNKKGVTIPSQIRYVQYFEKALQNKWRMDDFPVFTKKIVRIKLLTIPNFNFFGGCEPYFIISYRSAKDKGKKIEYCSLDNPQLEVDSMKAYIEFNLNECTVEGDVYVQFFHRSMLKKKEKMFQFWFNCAFFEPNGVMILEKNMLDTACKDKGCKKFSKEFQVEVHSTQPDQSVRVEYLKESYIEQNKATVLKRDTIISPPPRVK